MSRLILNKGTSTRSIISNSIDVWWNSIYHSMKKQCSSFHITTEFKVTRDKLWREKKRSFFEGLAATDCSWRQHDGKHPACDSSYFGRKEFSFTLEHDIYIRFQSFQDAADMEKSIKEKCPYKIDIGAVYNVDPAKRHAYAQVGDKVFTPVERELVFDIVSVIAYWN